MYPKNAASPEPIAIGPVVQISDGAVQTSGVTVRIKPIGVAEADVAGTPAYSTDGVVLYTPTQAETNYTSFILIAKKTGCIPAAITIVTTDTATPGRVNVGAVNGVATTAVTNVLSHIGTTGASTAQGADNNVILSNGTYGPAALKTLIDSVNTNVTNLNNLSALINIYGSPLLEIPDSGTIVFAFTVVSRDSEGKLVALDSSPTIAAANAAGTSRSANLSAVSNPETGRYTFTYTVNSTDVEESLRIAVTGAVSAEGRYIEWIGAVVNYDSLTLINSIKSETASILARTDVATSTRMATYPQPTGFLAANFTEIAADAEEARASLAFGGATTVAISSIKGDTALILSSTVAVTGAVVDAGATTTTFKTNVVAATGFYDDASITFTNGALAGQTKLILSFTATDGTFVVSEPFTSAPANSVQFQVNVGHTHPVSQIAEGLLDLANGVESSLTVRETLRILFAAMAGKVSGGGTPTVRFRDKADTKDRIVATVDASGNRSAITLDGT